MDIRVVWDLRAAQDAGGLLPGPGRDRVRHRQVARRGAVRRPAVDGDEDRRSRRRPAVRRGHPRRVSRQDAGLQPVAVVQLGHHGHERRRDAALPEELGKLGFVFNFITYGGHQIDGLAAEEFAALRRTACWPWPACSGSSGCSSRPTDATDAGGRPALDAALMAASGRTAATKAMGKGSTQHPAPGPDRGATRLLEEWLERGRSTLGSTGDICVELRPHTAGSDLLELRASTTTDEARQRDLRQHRRSAGAEHPLDPRSEHGRVDPQAAADDARPALPDSPLSRRLASTT